MCFEKQTFDFGKSGIYDEPMLDVLSAVLTIGFYPNVCYHKEKRKVSNSYLLYLQKLIFLLPI